MQHHRCTYYDKNICVAVTMKKGNIKHMYDRYKLNPELLESIINKAKNPPITTYEFPKASSSTSVLDIFEEYANCAEHNKQ